MASSSLLNRVMAFFRSPQGRQLVDRGRQGMNRRGGQDRPGMNHGENRGKLGALLSRFNRPR
ncbi:hypothetical protein J2S43_001589 [Catenuloplanes nepalensis]|uniref:Uncharacterized protein n=1 Tax=Catenuloplanes nepalensis TaxID=587533 RepID=A0ABT9MNU4_9ACTN|nr:hypothetical protein [Catenuloplanes nepalensis]